MNIIIKANHMDLTPALEKHIREKLSALDKFVGDDTNTKIEVRIGKTTSHHRHGDVYEAQINFNHKGEHHNASATLGDMYAAIDAAKAELLKEVASQKDKKVSKTRRIKKNI